MPAPADALYAAVELVEFARDLLAAAGMEREKAACVAGLLVEADLMGHTTHGLQLLEPYLEELASGGMRGHGEPRIVADHGGAVTWDGRRLPGVWLTAKAVDLAVERAALHGTATVVIRRSHHIGCLASFLLRATERGRMVVIACSDPSASGVAPCGGRRAVLTPNPIGIGIPTDGDPILVDMSASITTLGLSERLHREGRRFPGPWAIDATGRATDDPSVLFTVPPGALLPTGGLDHGHKGFGLALLVEALTQGLGGYGRAEAPTGWGASVFVLVFDPAAFGGSAAFLRETSWIANACRETPPMPGVAAVRLPGQQALERRRRALAAGVSLYPSILPAVSVWADKLGVAVPSARIGQATG
jgi:LDH2 family malate/lactate/ureidoglycolate dehydrogenase